ncbi:MAG: helix-turn-helix transcriptional regulator [bacterium]
MPLPAPIALGFSGLLAVLGVACAAQSILLARRVRAPGENVAAVRLAAVFLGLAAVHLIECAIATSPLARFVPHLHSTTFGLAYGFGPALWLVARRATNLPPSKIPAWLHALPVVVGTTSLLSWVRLPAAAKIAYLDSLAVVRPSAMGFGGLVAAQSLILLGFVYAFAAGRVIEERRQETGQEKEAAGAADRALARLAAVARAGRNAFGVYLVVFLAIQFLGAHTYQVEYLPSLLGAGVLLAFGRELARAPAIPAARGRARGPGQYRKATLPAERVPELLGALERTMTVDRAYLDPGLDLAGLASRLAISGHQLSQLLNRELGVTFADYVNARRVDEARQILKDPERRDLTILAVALDVGFRSKNTFTSAFKKHAGTTPSGFREN